MGFDQQNIHRMTNYLINDFWGKDWNLNNDIKEIHWDGDLSIDKQLATDFMTKKIPAVYNMKVKKISI